LSLRLALFDMDGTLIDSEAGILGSIKHAFEQIGAALPSVEVLRSWIGPPFHQTFPTALDNDPARVATAIAKYREHFIAGGWLGHEVYPGIAELIAALHAKDIKLAVVTSKPLSQARTIIDHLRFGSLFAKVYGPDPNTAHSTKAEMIAEALADFAIPANDAVMIGDRHFDIDGARAQGVKAIGVSWGYGSVEELQRAGADVIVDTPTALLAKLIV
jgi:phosphoglycolate phosphatase